MSEREEGDPRVPEHGLFSDRPPLPTWKRVLIFVAGWSVLAIGIAGLVLPGIQGVLTILIGVALLSLASETAYRLLRRALGRWPRLMETVDRWRHKLHDFFHKDEHES